MGASGMAKRVVILKNATIHVGNGEVFTGDVRIADGKIAEVGTCAVVKTCGHSINKITVRRDVALKGSFTDEVIRVFKGNAA